MPKSNAGQKFTAPPLRSPFFEAGTTPNSSYGGTSSGPTTKGPSAPDDSQQQTISRQWAQWTQAITNQFNAGIPITGSRSDPNTINQILAALDSLGFIKNNTTD